MSFGFSIGDVLAVGKLAYELHRDVWQVARGAPQDIKALGQDLAGLEFTLRYLADDLQGPKSILAKGGQARIDAALSQVARLKELLLQLETLVRKHKLAGERDRGRIKKIIARLKYTADVNEINTIRMKIEHGNGVLNLFLTTANSSSLQRIEQGNRDIMQQVQDLQAMVALRPKGTNTPAPPQISRADKAMVEQAFGLFKVSAEANRTLYFYGMSVWIDAARQWLNKGNEIVQFCLHSMNVDSTTTRYNFCQAHLNYLKCSWIQIEVLPEHPQRMFAYNTEKDKEIKALYNAVKQAMRAYEEANHPQCNPKELDQYDTRVFYRDDVEDPEQMFEIAPWFSSEFPDQETREIFRLALPANFYTKLDTPELSNATERALLLVFQKATSFNIPSYALILETSSGRSPKWFSMDTKNVDDEFFRLFYWLSPEGIKHVEESVMHKAREFSPDFLQGLFTLNCIVSTLSHLRGDLPQNTVTKWEIDTERLYPIAAIDALSQRIALRNQQETFARSGFLLDVFGEGGNRMDLEETIHLTDKVFDILKHEDMNQINQSGLTDRNDSLLLQDDVGSELWEIAERLRTDETNYALFEAITIACERYYSRVPRRTAAGLVSLKPLLSSMVQQNCWLLALAAALPLWPQQLLEKRILPWKPISGWKSVFMLVETISRHVSDLMEKEKSASVCKAKVEEYIDSLPIDLKEYS